MTNTSVRGPAPCRHPESARREQYRPVRETWCTACHGEVPPAAAEQVTAVIDGRPAAEYATDDLRGRLAVEPAGPRADRIGAELARRNEPATVGR